MKHRGRERVGRRHREMMGKNKLHECVNCYDKERDLANAMCICTSQCMRLGISVRWCSLEDGDRCWSLHSTLS